MIRRLVLCLLPLAGCDEPAPEPPAAEQPAPAPKLDGPERIVFDQILIAFKGSYRDAAFRTREEARELAYSLLDRIQSGVSFDALKEQYSDDRNKRSGVALGPYYVRNDGVKAKRIDEVERYKYAPRLRFMLFRLEVDDVTVADYDKKGCPLGWHILKRLR